MLVTLSIRNLALVETLTWELGPGLVGVTGETGAGKSIIVGALKLVLGGRADRDLIRTGSDHCTVEATFQPAGLTDINAVLADAGLEPCEGDQLIIKRVVAHSGQNRQFVNCSPVTLHVLKSLGQHLVDLHGPHDHQSLNSRERQLAMLDAAAQADGAMPDYRAAYQQWRGATAALDDMMKAGRVSAAELELLRYQVNEIDAAQICIEEEEPLVQRHRMAANATRLAELAGAALRLLGDTDSAVLTQLSEVRRLLRDLERTDRGTAEMTAGFENAYVELEDLERSLRRYQEGLDFDAAEAASLEDRINQFESLKRKYGGTLQRVLDHRHAAAARLAQTDDREGQIERLTQAVAEARRAVDHTASVLSQLRRKAAPRLAKEVSRHLTDLGFASAKFTAVLTPLSEPGPHGTEEVDFVFAPNPGEPAKPLRVIASSGEMSRVILAVKSALAAEDGIPLLVFDEIDANVGGEIAAAVGRKMKQLGRNHQIISITHLPQVAALASSHFLVTKSVTGGRTQSALHEVTGESRVEEIARMLGGATASARAHALTLLNA